MVTLATVPPGVLVRSAVLGAVPWYRWPLLCAVRDTGVDSSLLLAMLNFERLVQSAHTSREFPLDSPHCIIDNYFTSSFLLVPLN